jgi:N-acetylglucosaminyldiphosphoundecaprenol N-acetyl-beta-D-mannosaminyltransferase
MNIVKMISQAKHDDTMSSLPNLNVHLMERRITCMTIPSIVEAIHTACVEGRKITVANYNVHSFNLSMQLPWFYHFLQTSEIVNCDSIGILKAISYMGLDLPIEYRASYTLMMPKLLSKCNEEGLKVFLLGTKPELLDAALANLRNEYPNAEFAGQHGYFNQEDARQNQVVVEKINQFKPNILIVGMGMPIQEKWVYMNRGRLQVNAIMLGGAVIDRMAGLVPDCPKLIANFGCEWLFRLFREPKRLAARYLLGNPAFALHIALGKLHTPKLRIQPMPKIDSFNLERDTQINTLYLNPISQNQDFATNVYASGVSN